MFCLKSCSYFGQFYPFFLKKISSIFFMHLFIRIVATGLLLLGSNCLPAQEIAGIINRYTQVFSFDPCSGQLNVADTTGFRVGGRLLIHHSQGAAVNQSNNAQYGSVTDLGQAGRIEWAVISSVSAGALYLDRQLIYAIIPGTQVQAVTWPRFEQAVVTDTLRPLPWNGLVGGIVAIEVTGNLSLNAPILADGAGFRGGVSYIAPNNNCTWVLGESGYTYALGNWRGGTKGEGIAIPISGQELGRGPIANGGGGGNDHNSGGGGGANTAVGGNGGENDEPTTFGCDGFFPGLPGKALNSDTLRVYFGGGGGAGHCNNVLSSNGGAGGGLILVKAGTISGANSRISANGAPGQTTNGDGAGGGGAGGTILLQANAVPADLIVRAIGGNGGRTDGNGVSRCFGPGGGGGGGRLLLSLPVTNALTQGGSAGNIFNSTAGCNGNTNDATNGSAGILQPFTAPRRGTVPAGSPIILAQPTADTVCAGKSVLLEVDLFDDFGWDYQWERNTGTGWASIANTTTAQYLLENVTPDQSGWAFRCRIGVDNCGEIVSEVAELIVNAAPEPLFTVTPLSFGSFALENLSQNFTGGPLWDLGNDSTATGSNLVVNYPNEGEYEISMTIWNECDTITVVQTVAVLLPPVAGFFIQPVVEACGPVSVQFDNTSSNNAATYAWQFEGGNPIVSNEEAPAVTYSESGMYEVVLVVSNAVGSDTVSQVFEVVINTTPVAAFEATDLPNGPSVQFINNSINGLMQTWDFGDGSLVSNEVAPLHTFPASGTYQVQLQVVNACGASILEIPVTVDDDGVPTEEPAWRLQSRLFPNPNTGTAMLELPLRPDAVRLFDGQGKELWRDLNPVNEVFTLDLLHLPAGIYGLQVIVGREMTTFQIIRQ
jgi:PKD repeat protein